MFLLILLKFLNFHFNNLTTSNLHYEKFQDGSIKQVDVPFEIPESWEWVNLGQVGTLQRGSGIKKSETVSKGIQCVRYGEIYTTYDYFFTETVSSTTSEVAKRSLAVNADDILITLTGENKKDIGKAVAYLGNGPCVMGGDLSKLSNHKMNAKYLSFILNSPNVNAQKSALATGNIIVHISNSKLEKILVPIPPIKEQQEIVDKVEYYFSFVDEYKIVQNILKKINDEFPEKLRKSIMQYAMQGKLVPQDATDEPVEVLLEKIREEKQKLFTEGKLKKKDLQESIIYQGDDNSYYEKHEKQLVEIPKSWKWVNLKTIAFITMGQSPKSKDVFSQKIVDSIEFHQGKSFFGKFNLDESKTYTTNSNKLINKPSVLLSVRAPVGDVNYVNRPVVIGRGLASITCYKGISLSYLFNYLSTQKNNLESMATGSTFKAINSHIINNILVPLPPNMEQKRIVNKTEKILVLISKL